MIFRKVSDPVSLTNNVQDSSGIWPSWSQEVLPVWDAMGAESVGPVLRCSHLTCFLVWFHLSPDCFHDFPPYDHRNINRRGEGGDWMMGFCQGDRCWPISPPPSLIWQPTTLTTHRLDFLTHACSETHTPIGLSHISPPLPLPVLTL